MPRKSILGILEQSRYYSKISLLGRPRSTNHVNVSLRSVLDLINEFEQKGYKYTEQNLEISYGRDRFFGKKTLLPSLTINQIKKSLKPIFVKVYSEQN